MHKLLATLLAFTTLSGTAQQPAQAPAPPPPAGSNWQHVQALPIGASIYVKAKSSQTNCKLKSVDADTLTCTRGKDLVFQRADIVTIKIPHRGRSTLIGLAIGGGAGAAIGFGAGTNNSNGFFGPNFMRGAVTAVFGVGGGLIGAITGGLTDFSKSTVYKAP
jgi:hypothetical protein